VISESEMKIAVPIADTQIQDPQTLETKVISEGFQTLYNRASEKMAELGMMDEPDIVLEFTGTELRLLNPKNHDVLASIPATTIE
jgi:hypothetical protein